MQDQQVYCWVCVCVCVCVCMCVCVCVCVCVASVVDSNVAEQIRHGLSVVDPPDGLRQDHTDVHSFDFRTLELLHIVRHSVGHHHLEAQYNSLSASCVNF